MVARVDVLGNPSVYIRFSLADRRACPGRAECVDASAAHPRRSIAIRPEPLYEALRDRHAFEASADYAKGVRPPYRDREHDRPRGPAGPG
jgi:hypothetical protein